MQDHPHEHPEDTGLYESEVENGRREALFRLRNRLSRQPGDLKVIEEYVQLILESAEEEATDRLETYDRLEGFLFERAGDVSPDEVDDLLDMVSSLDERREEVLRESESDVQKSGTDEEVAQAYEEWEREGVDNTVPKDPKEARRKLSLCKEVRSFAERREETELEELGDLISRLQSAVQVDELLEIAEDKVSTAKEEGGTAEAPYLLQSVEKTVQQLMARRNELDDFRVSRIEEVTSSLEEASASVNRERRENEDRRQLKEFWDTYGEEIEELEAWDVFGEWHRFRPIEETVQDGNGGSSLHIAKTKKEPRLESPFTTKMHQLEEMLQSLNQLGGNMSTNAGLERVERRLDSLSEKLEVTQKRRKQTYNEFAMARIRKCFSKAEDATGAWNDKEKIADQLVEYLSEVDQRYLTSEVGRCYSEVFEHLYGKLKRAKSEDDFGEEGRKLNVLKRMHEIDPIGIEEF